MHTMNRPKVAFAAILSFVVLNLTLCNTAAQAHPLFFHYTAIADTKDRIFEELYFPCMNDLALIAFGGRFTTHVEGVFSRQNLNGFSTLADANSPPYDSFSLSCSINYNAMVEFTALQKVSDGYDTIVLRGIGDAASPLVDSTGTYNEIDSYQLNLVGKTVLTAVRGSDDAHVLLVKGVGALTGPERIILPATGAIAGFSFPLTDPAINSSGTVAYAATKNYNGSLHLITVTESGLVTELLDDSSPFTGISSVIMNDVGSMAFSGILAGGETGVWRLDLVNDRWNLTQLASSKNLDCIEFGPVAMNDLNAVTFGCIGSSMMYAAYLSNAQGLHQLVSPGTQLLGRTASQIIITRESVNIAEQIAAHVDFDDGTSAIVRIDPTAIPPWLSVITSSAFELSTAANGGSAAIVTPVNIPAKRLLLSFDVAFRKSDKAELRVMLGDKLLKSIAATPSGVVRQHVKIPLDLRSTAKGAPSWARSNLRFEIIGGHRAAVQISNVMIPGVFADPLRSDPGHRWKIDTSKGGMAGPVDTTAFPVGVQLQNSSTAGNHLGVAILSSPGFDAPREIIRSTLNINGSQLAKSKSAAALDPHCVEIDVNADKLIDLVCDAETTDSAVRVEAMTIDGWQIAGSTAVGR